MDANLTVVAPGTSDNDPPTSGIKFVVAHKNRLFVADDKKLYWSRLNKAEAFDADASDNVHHDDGQRITGLASIPGGLLIIFKEDSYYVLDGDGPDTWQISRLGPAVGCLSHRSIQVGIDALYWWAEQGPIKLSFATLSQPELIGANRVEAALTKTALNHQKRTFIGTALDVTNQRVIFTVPDAHQPRNTRLMVWSSRYSVWESDAWDPIDAASIMAVNDLDSQPFVMLGGYKGQVFKLGVTDNDGIVSGTHTGTFTASGESITSITDSGASFNTTGGGNVERKITVLDSSGNVQTVDVRPYLTANTGTVLTLDKAVSGLTSGDTYTYIIGGPDWQFDIAWRDFGRPFDKKRWKFAYVEGLFEGNSVYLDLLLSERASTLQQVAMATLTSSASQWDNVQWNAFNWNDGTITYARVRLARTGSTAALRFRQHAVDAPVTLLRAGLRITLLSDKLG